MPYAITGTGWRAINPDMELLAGESYAEEIPQWLLDASAEADALREATHIEDEWRAAEILEINNQLMSIEEADATGQDTGALPGTRVQWLLYRTSVRSWKSGTERFPAPNYRPVRP